jgi:predicted phosphodiesterase
MRVQLLSDLHLETEAYEPQVAADAELLILAGDIDSTWQGYERFRGWPVPVVVVAGNHEFDGRDLDAAWPRFREYLKEIGLDLLERDERTLTGRDGRRIRLLGTVRWSDFDLLGADRREPAMRAAEYFQSVMRARRGDLCYGPEALREDGIACRDWLAAALRRSPDHVAATLVVTHFAPSRLSVDPRYGEQPASASFCNDDDDLLAWADVWLHGHVHCQHDYRIGRTHVRCNARGHARRGEAANHDPLLVIDV